MTETGEPDWEAVRADYEAGHLLLSEVAHNHGTTLNRLHHRRRQDNWTRRNSKSGRPRRRNMLDRLMALIDNQISLLERRTGEDVMSATEMRMIETMTRALDRIMTLETSDKKITPKRVRLDAELLNIRERLAERIAQLDVIDDE